MKSIITLGALVLTTLTFAQTKELFNGKNLDGWTIYGTEKVSVR